MVFSLSVREAVLEGRHPFLHRFHWESPEHEVLTDHALRDLSIEALAAPEKVNRVRASEWRCVPLAHGMRVGIVQFIKGRTDTGEMLFFSKFPDLAEVYVMRAQQFLADPAYDMVLLDELNIALR